MIDDKTRTAFEQCFNSNNGKIVLAFLKSKVKRIRLDRKPTVKSTNPDYMNERSALFRSGMLCIVETCEGIAKGTDNDNDNEET